ncbi:MAG: alpha-amylase family glycosyl hydrolase [Paludibacter sp.]|nr:alpha-amylase family glycosyl hydrolase [Paludibacter sp.]
MKTNTSFSRFLYSTVFFCLFATFLFSQSTSVIFNVNMKYMAAQGLFNPTTEFVDLSGSFNNWSSTMLSDADGDSIYSASMLLNVGDNIEFKARINGLWNGREEFTGGGPNRNYTVVLNGVVNFWYNDLVPPTVLTIKIETSGRQIIPGKSVQFLDKSSGSPVEWSWQFPGGQPSGSHLQNPVVTYPTTGLYPVTLQIKNVQGDTISQTLDEYINVTTASTYWWNDAVFYEVFVRSFYDQNGDGKGDLKGLTAKLDYLNDGDSTTHTDLGITGIWLMPIMQSPSYHGYDVTDYRTVESDYGTNADFQTFIQAAHQRGIKVIIDLVMNHTSDQNQWFAQSAGSTTSPYRNWYRWSTNNPGGSWYYKNGAYYYGVFGSGMPDLNYANAATKAEMFDVARFWLQDMHADGFRLDAVKYIFESNTQIQDLPETFQFWKDFRTYYKSVNNDAFAVGEAWTSTPIIKKYVENNGLDFCFEFNMASALINSVNGGDATGLENQMDEVMASYPYLQFGSFLTNHDQERVMTTLGSDVTKAKLAARILLSLPGIPFIYYGEEIGTVGGKPDENIRTPLQWNSSTNAGFTTGTPWRAPQTDYITKNIATEQTDNNSLWTTYNKMIQIRQNEPALRRGSYTTLTSNTPSAFVFLRQYQNENIIVVNNLSNSTISDITATFYPGTLSAGKYILNDLITGATRNLTISADGVTTIQSIGGLAPRTTAIYKLTAQSDGLNTVEENTIQVYPVPSKGNITIQPVSKIFGVTGYSISDTSGKLLKKGILSGTTTLDLENWVSGFYLLYVKNGDQVITKKIIIEK